MLYRIALGLLIFTTLSCDGACSRVQPVKAGASSPEQELLVAIEQDRPADVRAILETARIKNLDLIDGKSPLKLSIDNLQFDVLTMLLNAGANPNVSVRVGNDEVPLLRYVFEQSKQDIVGYHSLIIGMLLDHGAQSKGIGFDKGFFNEILYRRIEVLAREGDLLFTNWFTILQVIFNQECLTNGRYRVESFDVCKNWVLSVADLAKKLKQNQALAVKVGDINWFVVSFDLCPDDDNKILPGVCGCGVADTDSNHDGISDCVQK
jgi:hypothetical protein